MSEGGVVVTGISGNLGRLLTRQLHRIRPVIGIDRRPFPHAPKDVHMHRIDIRSRRCEDVFRKNQVEAVIHMNIMHDPWRSAEEHHTFNIMGTQQLLEYCARYGVRKLVMLSTANLYGSGPRTMRYLREGSPLLGAATDTNIRDLVEVDMLCTSFLWQHPEVETVILRPVHICGPSIRNAPSNYFRLKRIPKLMGFDPMVQLLHEDDIVSALIAALKPGARGVFNVTGPKPAPLSAILDGIGRPVVEVPHPMLEAVVKRMHNARIWKFPPVELEHIRYGCMINGQLFRKEVGFEHQRSLATVIEALRERP
ncbi:MAG: UDP-glucose 4-epimerase [Myxococcota bacterium]